MKKKRRKIKPIPVLILLVIIFFLYLLVSALISFKIKNIYINGNQHLSDEYILDMGKVEEYPPVVNNFAFVVKNRLKSDVYILDAKVSYSFLGVLNIDVEENRVLFFYEHNQKFVLESSDEVISLPYKTSTTNLINFVPDIVYEKLIKKYPGVYQDIANKISQIKYDPSEYDKERFLLYMIDGNYVYITLNKLGNLNYYNDIYKTLNNKKGILYLDSGNHFQEIK